MADVSSHELASEYLRLSPDSSIEILEGRPLYQGTEKHLAYGLYQRGNHHAVHHGR
jgi:hypothetical protein